MATGPNLFLLLLFLSSTTCNGQDFNFFFATGGALTEMDEELPIGTVLVNLDVEYMVAGSFGAQREDTGHYALLSGPDNSYFAINPSSGELATAVRIDREADITKTRFDVSIIFISSVVSDLNDTQAVTLILRDINDNTPSFNQSLYEEMIPENLDPGSSFFRAFAADPDQAASEQLIDEEGESFGKIVYTISNGRVIYSIISGNELSHFSINPETGWITVSSRLDIDSEDFYNLTLLATDGGGLNDTATLLLTVLDSNDNPPIITYPVSFNITLSEDTTPELILIDYINATDDDYGLNAEIDYYIVSGDVTDSFTINSTTGSLILTSELDREAGDPLVLTIAAIDRGLPPLSATITVTINILDINDNPPLFAEPQYELHISESAPVGELVGTVLANDPDAGENGTVYYTMLSNTSSFALDNITGELRSTVPLDRETIPVYELLIQAYDVPANASFTLFTNTSVTIVIDDVNDNTPSWSYDSNVTVGILDTEPVGYSLIILQATDPDNGTNGFIQYEFYGSHSTDFVIDPVTGNVTVNADLDFGRTGSYVYEIRAYDGGSPSFESIFRYLLITVHTTNTRRPEFSITDQNLTLTETTPVGSNVLNVTAQDGDTGLIGELWYRIPDEWRFGPSGSFEVESETGRIFINDTLDYDYNGDDNSIFFQVEAYDGGFPHPLTARTNVTVYLINENDEAPLILVTKPFETPTIPENSKPFVQFANLSSLTSDPDPDEGGLFNFSLVEVYNDDYNEDDNITSSFSLSPDGVLTANRVFDRESRSEGYTLLILTTDFGYPTQSNLSNVTVAIGDENDQSPYFEGDPPSVTAYELIDPGEVILLNNTGLDDDIGDNAVLRYAISSGDERGEFTVDPVSGTISVAKVLNRTIQEYYNLTIIAVDQGQPIPLYGFGTVLVTVIDSNDNAPIFHEPLTASFPENSPIDFIFYTVNASDADEGTNSLLSYYFAPNSTDSFTDYDNITNITTVRFYLNDTSGELSVQDQFDREVDSSFEVTVIAIDSGLVPSGLTSTALITVLVQDVNDNAPVFMNNSYSFEVVENSPLDTLVGRVFADDYDATPPNNEIRFSLSGERSEELSVDPVTGVIVVNDTIDWEKGSNYTLSLTARDLGSPQLETSINLTILINDVNDRSPEWVESSLNISVPENSVSGTSVGFIVAIDPDSDGNNSLVTYSLSMDYSDSHFFLNSSTGEVKTLKTFNRESRDLYDLVVMATDAGTPQQFSSAVVYIEVTDSNDHDPVFTQAVYNGDVSESAPLNTPVLLVAANDDDIGINAQLVYSIISSSEFIIDPITGLISTASIFDYEVIRSYRFTVSVSDSGLPSRSATSTVAIDINDYNDNPPIFHQSSYHITILENIPVGSNLLQVSATDSDTQDDAAIEFLLIEGPLEVFGINNDTGVLYTHGFVNRESLGAEFNLTVLANNSLSSAAQSSTVNITININDFNDQAPSFNSTISVIVSEATPLGSVVYTLDPSDGDEGDNGTISYSLVDGNIEIFKLNETTGGIKLISALDYEGSQRFYYLTINASDSGNPPLHNFTTLILEVMDDNDNVPSLSATNYIISVSNTAGTGSSLLTVSATDPDTVSTLSYSIVEGIYSSLFSISQSTGSITLAGSLVSYSGQLLNITVEVTDGLYNASSTVSVHVTGPGSTPVFTSFYYSVSIPEDHDSTDPVYALYDKATPASPANVFAIIDGNYRGSFSISSTSLYVNSSQLDHESVSNYQLTLRVSQSSGYAYAVISVTVTDINEFPPLFSLSSFYIPLYETTPPGQPFFKLEATDRDRSSPANVIRYSIVSGDAGAVFSLDQITGELSLNRMLDYNSDVHDYTLNISASNTVSPPLSTTALLHIELYNGNRHTPVFSPLLYSTVLTESTPNGTYIGVTVKATDDDTGSDGEIRFGLLGDHRNYDFEIDAISGNISIGGEGLDYERQGAYQLYAVVSDGGVPQLSSTALVVVVIIDENDNEPIWEKDTYTLSINENTTVGSNLLTVRATDSDPVHFNELTEMYENTNGLVTYSIDSGDPLSQFSITPLTGMLRLVSSLNREEITNYTLLLNATDGGGRYANALCVVTVTDVNDVIPHFPSPLLTATIPENSPNETFITRIQARDEDITNGPSISYSILSGNEENAFYINSTTGEVYTNSHIDREENELFNLTVIATDNAFAPLTGSATLLIHVLDINEVPPTFDRSYYNVSVLEDQALDQTLINITATDTDFGENATILYSIVLGDLTDSFSIDSNTGALTLSKEIDYEFMDFYNLTVRASDSGHVAIRLTNDVMVAVIVEDVNDNQPLFDQDQYIVNISEATDPDSEIITVFADDYDSGSNSQLTYSIINDYNTSLDEAVSADGNFIINETTGAVSLSLTPSLDRETQSNYTLTIRVRDNGTPSLFSTSQLLVLIDDVNDNQPLFLSGYYQASISENLPSDTTVLGVSATDADIDSNAQISYELTRILPNQTECLLHCPTATHLCPSSYYNEDNELNDTFTINSDEGVLYTATVLDREDINYYILLVTAYDWGTPSLSTSVCAFINITDTNDESPVFNQSHYYSELVENSPNGSFILTVSAADLDIGNNSQISYNILDGFTYFAINPLTGAIYSMSPLDREERDSYNITVTATDGGVPPNIATATITIAITDLNDSPPQFEYDNYTGAIQENSVVESLVISLRATDDDIGSNAELSYSIVSIEPPVDHFIINTSTGSLTTGAVLDREAIDYYQLTVLVSDNGSPSLNSTTLLSVVVTDDNDNPPLFVNESYYSVLVENVNYDQYQFASVHSTDSDIGNNSLIYYTITNINSTAPGEESSTYKGDAVFNINDTNGELYISGTLDTEETDTVILTIQAYNELTTDQLQYSTVLMTITVEDINDNSPVFTQPVYNTGILESAPVGSPVITVTAYDSDNTVINSDLYYSILSPVHSLPFIIDNITGLMETNGSLDREIVGQYEVTVVATDTGSPPLLSTALVNILILNTNDNRPIFNQPSYHFTLLENQSPGTLIGSVLATDVDLSNITYQLAEEEEEESVENIFFINSTTGELTSLVPLDRETKDHYSFIIEALDDPVIGLGTQVNVTVSIIDQNDNPPLFEQQLYTTAWPEDAANDTELIQVNASDLDFGVNSNFSFFIINSSPDLALVRIEEISGSVVLIGAFDRESVDMINVSIAVIDDGNPPLSSTALLIIDILDVNDNLPLFTQPLYSTVISEDINVNTTILILSASDLDIDSNGQFSFSISNESDFTIEPSSGAISVARQLDYERTQDYLFEVIVRDHGNPPLSSTAMISVNITDVNDNPPHFEQEVYYITVPENSVLYTPVFTVPGHDPDNGSNGELRYTILSGNIGFHFTLDEVTGVLQTTLQYLDREIRDHFTLSVRAVDQGSPQYTASTTIDIGISDINDHYPEFSSQFLTLFVPESSLDGTVITRLIATDSDIGTNSLLTHTLIQDEEGSGFTVSDIPFDINSTTGEVVVNGSLDRETQPVYSLSVLVTDSGSPPLSDSIILNIHIQDTNEYTPCYSLPSYNLNISIDTAVGTTIAHLTATDPDTDTSLTYSIISTDTDTLAINSNTGELYVYSPLLTGSYILSVSVSDTNGRVSVMPVGVTVHDSHYTGPLFNSPTYHFSISEDSDINSTIGSVGVSTDSILRFILPDGQNSTRANDVFSLRPDGRIILVGPLDYESISSFVLNIEAVSLSTNERAYTVVTISIIDVNDNIPLLSAPYYHLLLSEATPLDTVILTLSAYDLDSPGINSQTLISLSQDSNQFSLDPITGAVTLTQPLDRERDSSLQLIVNVSNERANPVLYSTATISITVLDINDNAPEFSQVYYSVDVPQSSLTGSEILSLSVTDNDSGSNGELVYFITHQSLPEVFSIDKDNGSIYINKELSLEEEEEEEITVSLLVTDRGSPTPRSSTSNVFINIYKDNINPPIFTQPNGYSLSIDETLPVGSDVLMVSAVDPDRNQTDSNAVYYSLHSTTQNNFVISPVTGLVLVSAPLDFNVRSFFSLVIMATDYGRPPQSTATVLNISLIDINNHNPDFNQSLYTASITEGLPIGSPVLLITATDIDSAELRYQITVNHYVNDTALYGINETTGLISTASDIDYEITPFSEILVSAIDSGYPLVRSNSVPVQISVNNINDEAPIFSQVEYYIDVIRLLTRNQSILNINATDPDNISDTTLTYSINDDTGLYSINDATGMISTLNDIPENTANTSTVSVTVTDGTHSSAVTVYITVLDEGDFCETGGYCTSVVPRSLTCEYIIPNNPTCDVYCSSDRVLSPMDWLCISHYCLNNEEVPCNATKECLHSNRSCAGQCPSGTSLCPTTDHCHSLIHSQPCDDTYVCLVDQTLIQRSNGSRYCAISSTLPPQGKTCSGVGAVYCEEFSTCSNITAPHLCKACPSGLVPCPSDSAVECVSNVKECCPIGLYYCGVLGTCLNPDQQCRLPNVPPLINSSLFYIDTITSYGSGLLDYNGYMIGTILSDGNNTVATDSQSEEISIVIIEVSNNSQASGGQWQYSLCGQSFNDCLSCPQLSSWINITNVSEDNALYLPNTACLRFWRETAQLEGGVWMRVKLWDGNTDGFHSNSTTLVRSVSPFHSPASNHTPTSGLSFNYTVLVSLLLPVTESPSLTINTAPFTILEDETLVNNTGKRLSDINTVYMDYLPSLPTAYIQGLTGVMEDLLPSQAVSQYYSTVTIANALRSQRLNALSNGQDIGVGLSISTSSVNWQVSFNGDPQLFVYLSDVLTDPHQVLLLNSSALIRYIPAVSFNGNVSVRATGWDGILPSFPTLTVHNTLVYISTLDSALSEYHVSEPQSVVLTVQAVPDNPVITLTQYSLPPSPYILEYSHYSMITVLVDRNVTTLRPMMSNVEDILRITLEEPVTVRRLYPSPSQNSTYISFSTTLNITEVMKRVSANNQIQSILPISHIGNVSRYGPGSGCHGNSDPGPPAVYSSNTVSVQVSSDDDKDQLGLAIVGVMSGQGTWQYKREGIDAWIKFPTVITPQRALLLNVNDSFRFVPRPHYYWSNVAAPYLIVKSWDKSLGALGETEYHKINVNTDPYINTTRSLSNPIGRFSSSTSTLLATRLGCDDVVNSGKTHDSCCVCGGDGAGCVGCDAVLGSNALYDGCNECNGEGTQCLGCDAIPWSMTVTGSCNECISSDASPPPLHSLSFRDCAGVCYGTAALDECGDCTGGVIEYNQNKDCNGLCYGNATIDNCGQCSHPQSLNSQLDCTGVCGGVFRSDSCGICQLPEEGTITDYTDCNGDCWGTATLDACGVCHSGNTGLPPNSMDACGVCNGDNSTCYGCDGVLNSGLTVDSCGQCGGNDCSCFHLTSVSPSRGPQSGGTSLIISGAGFYKNSSNYNTSLPLCGGYIKDLSEKAIPVTCRFTSLVSEEVDTSSSFYIINQRSISCSTPSPTSEGEDREKEEFIVQISIDNGPFSNPLPYLYEDYSIVTVTNVYPRRVLVGHETLLSFVGRNFLNTSHISCLINGFERCSSVTLYSVPAQYNNDSSIFCLLPPSSSPCQVNISLSFDGQSSGVVTSFSFNYSYSPPEVNSIHFSDNLTSLIVSLDRSSDVINNQPISCDAVFSKSTLILLGTDSRCYWSDAFQRTILVTLSPQAVVSVGSPIVFRERAIITRGQLYSFEVPHLVVYTVSSDTNAVSPVIELTGPTTISTCAISVEYTASNSYYQGYKGLTFKWSVHTNNSTIPGFLQLVNTLNSLPVSSSEVSLPTSLFQSSVQYTLQLNVTNSLGLSTIKTKTLTKSSSSSLQVAITGSSEIITDSTQTLIFESSIVSDACSLPPSSTSFVYQWRLYAITDLLQHTLQEVPLANVSISLPMLLIPPQTLNISYNYELQLSVSADTLSANTSLRVSVKPLSCTTSIHGGNRNISSTSVIALNATATNLQGINPSFVWGCSVASSGLPCYNTTQSLPVIISLPSNLQAAVPASHLQPGEEYNFTLIDNRRQCSPSLVIIRVSTLPPIAVVQILPPSLPVKISELIVIEGLVYSTDTITAHWECLRIPGQGYIDVHNSNYSLSSTSYNTVSTDALPSLSQFEVGIMKDRTSRTNLILQPYSLQPGLPYTFQLSAANGTNSISSTVTVTAGAPPIIHQARISPENGAELSTSFTIQVNWTTDNINDQPLYYQYGVKRDNSLYWLTGITNSNKRSFILPHDSNTVYIRAYDRMLKESSSAELSVAVSSSTVNHLSLLTDLQSHLGSTKDWSDIMSRFVAILLSIDDTTNAIDPEISVSLYTSILNSTPLTSLQHRSLLLSTMKLISLKLSLSSSQKMILLNNLNTILNTALNDVDSNFILADFISETDSNSLPLLLTSDRVNRPPVVRGLSDDDISVINTILNQLFTSSYNSGLAERLRVSLTKLSSIICQQTHLGEKTINITTHSLDYILTKTPPFGTYYISNDSVFDLRDSLKSHYNQQCSDTLSDACTDHCVQFASMNNDYFSDNELIRITSESRERIESSLEGVDSDDIKLHSSIVDMKMFSSSQSTPLSLSSTTSPIHIYMLARPLDINTTAQPVCMYRDSSVSNNNLWVIPSFSPPVTVTLNASSYYRCEYSHFTEYAIGLLPPPVIIVPSSSLMISSSPSPILSSPLISSDLPSFTPPSTAAPVSNVPAIVSSVVVILFLIIIGSLLLVTAIFLWYKRKNRSKMVIAPEDQERQAILPELVKQEKKEPSVSEDKEPPEKGMTLGVIQLKGEERQLLGSVNILHTMRLRELREILVQTFPNTLKSKLFYLCTKELSDIEPASEQQQFVNLVYSNIVYIREVSEKNEQTKKQFCVCGYVAQFECSGCGARGYCSQDCQTRHWNEEGGGHQKECQRVTEKRQRTDILLRRQLTDAILQGIPEEVEGGGEALTSPTSWKGYLSESRKFSTVTRPSVTTLPALPPVNTGRRIGRDETHDLRNQIDTTVQLTPSSTRPKLVSTGNISVGRLASVQSPTSPILRKTQSQVQTSPAVSPLKHQGSFTAGGQGFIPPLSAAAPLSPIASRPSIGSIPPVSPTGVQGQFQWGSLPPHPTAGTDTPLLNSSLNERTLFSRPVLQSRISQDSFSAPPPPPTLRRDLSISSVGSVDLNMSLNATGTLKKKAGAMRHSTLQEEDEEESSSSSESEDEEEREERTGDVSRPPSLSVRRRHSSRQESRDGPRKP